MKKYQYLNKIVIEALREWPKSPIISRLTDNEYDYFPLDDLSLMSKHKSTVEISDIDLSQWKVTMHYEYLERFKKVAAVVGNDKAEEVLRALDG